MIRANPVTLYGVAALSFMMLMYAGEGRGRRFIIGFAVGCVLSSLYGFLSGAWPFGVIEAGWSVIALRRYMRSESSHGGSRRPTASDAVNPRRSAAVDSEEDPSQASAATRAAASDPAVPVGGGIGWPRVSGYLPLSRAVAHGYPLMVGAGPSRWLRPSTERTPDSSPPDLAVSGIWKGEGFGPGFRRVGLQAVCGQAALKSVRPPADEEGAV